MDVPRHRGKPTGDHAGRTYGYWTVLYPSRSIKGRLYWLCRCRCGVEREKKINEISTKGGSCGCQFRLAPGEPAKTVLLCSYKQSARARSYAWALTREQFVALTMQACAYCGIAPSQVTRTESGDTYIHSGVDRKDNTEGYSIDNCLPCCTTCNRAKGSMTFTGWLEWITHLTTYRRSCGFRT